MATAREPTTHRWTTEEYDAACQAGIWDEDSHIELLDGALIEVEVTQGPRHSATITILAELLRRDCPGKIWHVREEKPLAASCFSEPEPDIAVVVGAPSDYRDHHPTIAHLVVEVADRSLYEDRGRKADIYALAGIPTYWIVNLRDDQIEVFTEPVDGRYQHRTVLKPGDDVSGLSVAAILGKE